MFFAFFQISKCFKTQKTQVFFLQVLDLRIRAVYPVHGGILADKIGYGKTARFRGKDGVKRKGRRKVFSRLLGVCWPI